MSDPTPGPVLPPSTLGLQPKTGFGWRTVSSIVLWAIMLAVIFWLPGWSLYLFMTVVLARATWEYYRIAEARGLPSFKFWGTAGAVALISGGWFFYQRPDFAARSSDYDVMVLLIFALGVFIRQFPEKLNTRGVETMAITLFGLIYVAWLGNFITRINFATDSGRYWVMFLVVVTKFTDIGAYLIGSTLGRHKMIPRISPKKTWEGTFGGILFAVGGSLLCWHFIRALGGDGLNLTHALALGLLLGVAAVIGDLAESLIKREAGVKDSSAILPGHGGALDLVDSLLFTAPLLYVYIRIAFRW